ncbi:aldo/keto reductase [Bacillus horti]|uniref:Aryl-alcohol dehydrogenase-like predicted oxidoreductase n=1 Tax=Caldalkalibacillus horti TaxID=77523 RepID=A0ABT9VW94_9BACI|nr:aldo/keto reductase [Bacillus horti]MDQ0165264.1 aryl-alcohol dehydrogenase-like predicted oxidoreductase [Bacillus horti]
MRKLPLGKTGLTVSELSLGCMNFGTRTDEETSVKVLDQYVEAGGSFLDTSNNYSFWNEGGAGGESERLLGRWMKERGNREKLFVATKVGAMPTEPGAGLEKKEGLAKKVIEKAIDKSLKHLDTEYVDLYYAHIDDRDTPLEETLEAFNSLIQSGKVRAIGCSNYLTWRIEQARQISLSNQWAEYSCVQQRFTYLRPKTGSSFGIQYSINDEMLDYGKAREDLTLIAYSPLLGGYYSNQKSLIEQYEWTDSDHRMKNLFEVAKEVEATPNQVVLAWLLQNSPTIIPIIGASHLEQLKENIESLKVKLSKEQLDRLNNNEV